VSALLQSLAEGGAALPAARRAALDSALAEGLPSQRNERWKYTSLRALGARRFALASAVGEVDAALLAGIEGPRLVFVNGVCSAGLSRCDSLPAGLEFGPLAGEAEDAPAPPFARADEVFARLNYALATGGTLLRVAAGARIETPLHLVSIGTAAGAELATHLRHRVALAAGARLTLVEHQLAAGEHRNLDNQLLQLELAAGAELVHARLQDAADGATLVARTDARLGKDARYRRVDLELGAALSRHELNVSLSGEGARFESSGALLAGGRRHLDTRLGVLHDARDTSCDLLWRGLAAERGKLSFHGGITIAAGADGSDASLSNKNLLLSPNAEIDTQPVLEIHADEVKAAHGATVGRLDPGALFYLRARGISLAQARVLLTLGFCREALAAIGEPALVEALSPPLEARLAALKELA
jgi:Fe-S cluster assembly protein SufD